MTQVRAPGQRSGTDHAQSPHFPEGKTAVSIDQNENNQTTTTLAEHLGAGISEMMVPVQIDEEILADPSGFQDAELPGLPAPLDGARFDALKASIEQHGQMHPIYVGKEDLIVYAGRSRRQACLQLKQQVRVCFIPAARGPDTARATALQRDMTIEEKAMFIKWVQQNVEYEKEVGGKADKEKSRDVLGRWLKRQRGWATDTSGRQISNFLALAGKLQEADPDQVKRVAGCATVREALDLFRAKPEKRPDDNQQDLKVGLHKALRELRRIQDLDSDAQSTARELFQELSRRFGVMTAAA